MKYARLIPLLSLMALSTLSLAADIQVSCEPGLEVYLDGELMGTSSSRDDGLYLMNVPRGVHTIRVEKEGFLPQSFEVELLDHPIELKVEKFAPEEPQKAPAAIKQVGGRILVTSAPQNCDVSIDGEVRAKNSPQLSIGGLAAGEHTIVFSKEGYDPISSVIVIKPGAELAVRGNLVDGAVEFVSEGHGSLRVISDPPGATILFLGKTMKMTSLKYNVSHIPAGAHPITVSWRGLELSSNVTIMAGQRTVVRVSFMKKDEPFTFSYEPEGKRGRGARDRK